jgi:predicted NAD-dependent protein-ADP-ribosyltransferase YbiA (DUF1768 family)
MNNFYFNNIKHFGIPKYMIYNLRKDENNINETFQKMIKRLYSIILRNNKLKVKLLNTSNKVIFFCLKEDFICGVGFSLSETKKKYLDELTGQNLIGQLLMEVRNKLILI